ncbi:MAG: hypothetical protein NVS4B3_23440 [Gemmatimonadaceae bacterium]
MNRVVVFLILLASLGCGTYAFTGPLPLPNVFEPVNFGPMGFSVALSPAALSIAKGARGSAKATLTRGGLYPYPVTLSVTDAPPGLAVTLTPAIVFPEDDQSTITVAAGASVAAGSYTLTVKGTGDKVPAQKATLPVRIK